MYFIRLQVGITVTWYLLTLIIGQLLKTHNILKVKQVYLSYDVVLRLK